MTKSKTKKETSFWAYLLSLLVVNAVKTVGFVITCLLFYWASVQALAKLGPMQALPAATTERKIPAYIVCFENWGKAGRYEDELYATEEEAYAAHH